jgi:hypothetical protein
MTEGFSSLSSVNLKKNNIGITVEETGTETIPGDPSYVYRRNFTIHVFQGGVEKSAFKTTGCGSDQPFVIDGYGVVDQNWKIDATKLVLLLSRKSDCMEGGYIGESLHTLAGIKLNNTESSNVYKRDFPLYLNEGTLVAYVAGAHASDHVASTTHSRNDRQTMKILGGVVALLAIGVIAGRLSAKRVA